MRVNIIIAAAVLIYASPIFAQDTNESCFPYNTAYVTGKMNIREEATTNSPIVGTTNKGDTFDVSEARLGNTWCWLKVEKGWMAYTRLVSHGISDILPSVTGSPYFQKKITKAFELMEEKSPEWFKYTVAIINSVVSADLSADKAVAQVIRTRPNQVKVDSNQIRRNAIASLASTLVHEACHLYQYRDTPNGRSLPLSQYERESDCLKIQAKALSRISPGHPRISRLWCAARNPMFYSYMC